MKTTLLMLPLLLIGCASTRTATNPPGPIAVSPDDTSCKELATLTCKRGVECGAAEDPNCEKEMLDFYARKEFTPHVCSLVIERYEFIGCKAIARAQVKCSSSDDCIPGAACSSDGICVPRR